MNYVFDVSLNFNKVLYDFYEWNKEDEILYFLKIPVFKVENELIYDFIINDIRVDNLFLKKIYNKSKIYFNKQKYGTYSCIITSSTRAVGLNFDKNGFVIGKSNLSLEEETEVVEFSKFIKYSIINYKIIKKNSIKRNYLTRKEYYDLATINNYLSDLEKNNKIDELKYIYYELFEDIENDYYKIKQKIGNNLNFNNKRIKQILEIMKYVY